MFDLYRRTQVGDAVTYVRPYQTISTGLLGENNSMTIFEEKIIVLSDNTSSKVVADTQELHAVITNPNASFDIVNPATGEAIGTMTFAQLKVQMYSLYLYLAAQRDALEAEESPLPPEE